MDEKELVREVLAGDKLALRRMVRELTPKLRRYILSRVSDKRDAEELVQDTLLSLLDALPLFGFKSQLWTFVCSIARHEVTDYWRKKYAKKAIRAVPLIGGLYDRALYSAAETSQDMVVAVEKVYRLLPASARRLLQWKYEEDLSVREIAAKLKVSVKAAESKLYRARMAFQEKYRDLYGEPFDKLRVNTFGRAQGEPELAVLPDEGEA